MTAPDDVRDTISIAPLPTPRAPGDDALVPEAPAEVLEAPVEMPEQAAAAPRSAPARFPWPEPWGYNRAARPRTEFWDVASASWRSRGPVLPPPEAS